MTPTFIHASITAPSTVRRAALRLVAFGLVSVLTSPFASAADKIIDIMMVYTPAATTYNGGASGIKAHANAAIASLNAAFENSQIEARARLVYAGQLSYTESGNFNTDLTALRTNGDGKLDTVHSLRTTYGADYVCLIRRGPAAGVAGMAYVMTTVSTSFASFGFSVVADVYSTGNYAFAHEIGHNLGCNHDRANTSSTLPFNYSYGYNFYGTNGLNYGTVMCYPGIRVLHFSNPDVSYQGTPTGVASGPTAANNALAITNTRSTAASLVGARDFVVAGDATGDGKGDLFLGGRDGGVTRWTMDGATRTAAEEIDSTFTAASWSPFALADVNQDGSKDLVFRSTDGRLVVWYMNGTTRSSFASFANTFTANAWTPFAAADMNGNGTTDILFYGKDGRIVIWYMNGTARTSFTTLSNTFLASSWTPFGATDVNGDSKPDLIFRSTDGRMVAWLMNGTSRTSSVPFSHTFTAGSWTPVTVSDFDADSKPDVALRGSDGSLVVWFMNGTTRLSASSVSHTLSDE